MKEWFILEHLLINAREIRKKKAKPIITIYDLILSGQFKAYLNKSSFPKIKSDNVYNHILPDYYEHKQWDTLNINPYNFLLPDEKLHIMGFFRRVCFYIIRKNYSMYYHKEQLINSIIKLYFDEKRGANFLYIPINTLIKDMGKFIILEG